MKIYLDACCLARLTDDQAQARIRSEAEAVEQILRLIQQGRITWTASQPLIDEISRNPSRARRLEGEALLALALEMTAVSENVVTRAKQLEAEGYGPYDSLHLAAAEFAGADVLLSTDDRFIRKASRGDGTPLVPVQNPISWLEGRQL